MPATYAGVYSKTSQRSRGDWMNNIGIHKRQTDIHVFLYKYIEDR